MQIKPFSILHLANTLEVQIYHNSTNGKVVLVFQAQAVADRSIKIVAFQGKLPQIPHSREKEMAIDFSTYSQGIYFVSIVEGDICVKQKIVKL